MNRQPRSKERGQDKAKRHRRTKAEINNIKAKTQSSVSQMASLMASCFKRPPGTSRSGTENCSSGDAPLSQRGLPTSSNQEHDTQLKDKEDVGLQKKQVVALESDIQPGRESYVQEKALNEKVAVGNDVDVTDLKDPLQPANNLPASVGVTKDHDINNVSLHNVPSILRQHIKKAMVEFRGFFDSKGNNAHRKVVRGKCKWNSMEMPHKDPEIYCMPCTPENFLVHKFGRVKMFFPELLYGQYFPGRQMLCKWHGRENGCVTRHTWFNPNGPRVVLGNGGQTTFLFCGIYMCTIRKKAKANASVNDAAYTFRGYDADVVMQMPRHVQHALGAVLYGRNSAIETEVLASLSREISMKSAFRQKSLQLKEALKERFYEVECNYVDARTCPRACGNIFDANQPFDSFPLINDFVFDCWFPDERQLVDLYLAKAATLKNFHRAHMQLVDGTLLKADKSFKVVKYVFVPGASFRQGKAFDSVYTVMNEKGQVVAQYFTRTSDVEEMKGILQGIQGRFAAYGFGNIELFYTDDCCHEYSMLANTFSSLKDNREKEKAECNKSEEASKYQPVASLAAAVIDSHSGAEEFAGELAQLVAQASSEGMSLFVGFDVEWLILDTTHQPKTLQLAACYGGKDLYALLQLELIMEKTEDDSVKNVPNSLSVVLNSPHVCLVGTNVRTDIGLVERHWGGLVDSTVCKWEDLATTARRLGIIRGQGGSLQFLARVLIKKHLPKDDRIRLSNWGAQQLSPEQIEYAVLDAIASRDIAIALSEQKLLLRIPTIDDLKAKPLVRVFTPTSSSSLAAIGEVSDLPYPDGSVPIMLLKIFKKNTRVPARLNPSLAAGSRTLASVGIGGTVVWDRTRLRLACKNDRPNHLDDPVEVDGATQQERRNLDSNARYPPLACENASLLPEGIDPSNYSICHSEDHQEGEAREARVDAEGSAAESSCSVLERATSSDQPNGAMHDEESTRNCMDWTKNRVKLDLFHAKQRLTKTLKKSHGCYPYFCELLSEAFFVVDKDDWDQQALLVAEGVMKKKRVTAEEAANLASKELLSRRLLYASKCRRLIPAPSVLKSRLESAVRVFADVRDAKSGETFLTQNFWNAYKNVMRHVQMGCLSDLPGYSYYSQDQSGRLRCSRGTNSLEGYHFHIRSLIQQFYSSPELCIAILEQFNYRWNINRMNERGILADKYSGFYAHYLIEEIQQMLEGQDCNPVHPEWISSLDYEPTGEEFYMPVGEATVQSILDTGEADEVDCEQGTPASIPVQPIASKFEKDLFEANLTRFRRGTSESRTASCSSLFDFSGFALWWEQQVVENEAELDTSKRRPIFRKTRTLLADYYNRRKKKTNEAATMAQSHPISSNSGDSRSVRDVFEATKKSLADSMSVSIAPPAKHQQQVPSTAKKGINPSGVLPVQALGDKKTRQDRIERASQQNLEISKKATGETKQKKICRRCGLPKKGRNHSGGAAANSVDYCTTPEADRLQGYPMSIHYTVGGPPIPKRRKEE